MSVKNIEGPFEFHADNRLEKFTGIIELGFNERGAFVIDAFTSPAVAPTEPRGSYFTVLPISPIEYRQRNAVRTGFTRKLNSITVYDDGGTPYTIYAKATVIDDLVTECIAHEIPRRERA